MQTYYYLSKSYSLLFRDYLKLEAEFHKHGSERGGTEYSDSVTEWRAEAGGIIGDAREQTRAQFQLQGSNPELVFTLRNFIRGKL